MPNAWEREREGFLGFQDFYGLGFRALAFFRVFMVLGCRDEGGWGNPKIRVLIWEFPTIRGYLIFGILVIRILLFRVLYSGPHP